MPVFHNNQAVLGNNSNLLGNFNLLNVKQLFLIIFQGPDLECDKKCENNGWCNAEKMCQCPEGYMGQYCKTALCYPQCMNNGTCVAPGVCRCPLGFQGPHCEGGNAFNRIFVFIHLNK